MNLEDLQTPSGSTYSHIHEILSVPPFLPTNDEHKRELGTVKLSTSPNDQPKGHKPCIVSSELTTDTYSMDSPGMIPVLNSSITTPLLGQHNKQTNRPIMSTPRPSNTFIPGPIPSHFSGIPGPIPSQFSGESGPIPNQFPGPISSQFSQIGQTRRVNDIPLLHLDSSGIHDRPSLQKGIVANRLEDAYPDLVRNLSLITPQPFRAASLMARPETTGNFSKKGGRLAVPSCVPPLLGISRVGQEAVPLQREKEHIQQHVHPPGLPLQHPKLLTLPDFITHPSKWQQLQEFPARVAPNTHSHTLHTHHHFPVAHTQPNQAPPPRTQPTASIYAPPSQLVPPLSDQYNYRLPHVPITPFIPKLLPPHLLQARQHCSDKDIQGPKLLQANEHFSAFKRDGLKLLEIPKSVPQFNPPKPFSLDTELPPSQKISTSCQTVSQHDDGGNNVDAEQVIERTPVIEHQVSSLRDLSSVSDGKSQSSLESNGSVSNPRSQTSSLFSITDPQSQVKKGGGSRKRKRHSHRVTLDQEEPKESHYQQSEYEEAKNKTPSLNDVQISDNSSSVVEPCPQLTKTNEIGHPSLRRPMFGKDSHRNYPVDIPLESLEVRRLNLQAASQNEFPKIESKVDDSFPNSPVLLKQTDVSIQVDTVSTDIHTVHTSSCYVHKEGSSSLSSPHHSHKSVQVGLSVQGDPNRYMCNPPNNATPTELTVEQNHRYPSSADNNHSQKRDNKCPSVLNTRREHLPLTANDQYRPPVLALNVSEPPAPKQMEVSTSSLSLSSCSESQTSKEEVGLSRIEPPATSNSPRSESVSNESPCQLKAAISKPDSETDPRMEFGSVIPDISPGSNITNVDHLQPLKSIASPPFPTYTNVDGSHATSPLPHGFVDLSDKDVAANYNAEVVGELATHMKTGTVKSVAMKRLHELEEQLNAIEHTAKSVEGEFKASKQVG